jgi:hypothetical protein
VTRKLTRNKPYSRDADVPLGDLKFGEILKASMALRRNKGELAWLIDFIQREPGETSKGFQKCLREMLIFCMTAPAPFPDPFPDDLFAVTAADVDRIAKSLRTGILHVVTGDEEVWSVPGAAHSRALIGWRENDGSISIFDRALMKSINLETRMGMVAQALIVENQARVRICARENCGRLFAKVRRQEFCSVRCSDSQRKRDWRARTNIRAEENRLKREAYLRKLWKKENK